MNTEFFQNIDDQVARRVDDAYGKVFQAVKVLASKLGDMDSYAEMGEGSADKDDLLKAERSLANDLQHSIAEQELPESPDPAILQGFLEAYALEGLYPDTVGPFEETISTLPLKTLPLFKVRQLRTATRQGALHELFERFDISTAVRGRIAGEVQLATERLSRRRQLLDHLRERVTSNPDKATVKALFDRYFPDNPFAPEEVDVVVTRTCAYWCVPSEKLLQTLDTFQQRDEPERTAVLAYLKVMRRFTFQYFSHFPTFSSFDARDAEPAFVREIAAALELPLTEAVSLLNSSTTIESTDEIEKYLIHDTWGHMWQADLTGLQRHYDSMESLRSPVDANEHVDTGDGNIVSMLDVLYLNMRGHIDFDEELAKRFADAWIRVRLEALLTPITAELTADVIEYKYRLDNDGAGDLLPSSSLFGDNPAKLDFAWVDMSYFVRTLSKTNARYFKNDELRANLIERIRILLKMKYPRQFRNVSAPDTLLCQISEAVDRFLAIMQERQELHLNQDTESGDDKAPAANAFFRVFTNLLQIQFTVNQIVREHLENEEYQLDPYFNVLTIFAARHFSADPLRHFWSLDEALAAYALPMLRAIRSAEQSHLSL